MIRWIRYKLAVKLQEHMLRYRLKMLPTGWEIDKQFADRWNNLEACKLTKGRIKIKWGLWLKK